MALRGMTTTRGTKVTHTVLHEVPAVCKEGKDAGGEHLSNFISSHPFFQLQSAFLSNLTSRQETQTSLGHVSHKCVTDLSPYGIRPVIADLPKVTKCVVGSPLTQENHLVVVSGVTGTHSNANAAYKYTSTSRLF